MLARGAGSAAARGRRTFLTGAAYRLARKAMPSMSETEKVALSCGSVGFDRDIFSGSPSFKHLVDTYTPRLSAEEEAFLKDEVEVLCRMLDDHDVVIPAEFAASNAENAGSATPPGAMGFPIMKQEAQFPGQDYLLGAAPAKFPDQEGSPLQKWERLIGA